MFHPLYVRVSLNALLRAPPQSPSQDGSIDEAPADYQDGPPGFESDAVSRTASAPASTGTQSRGSSFSAPVTPFNLTGDEVETGMRAARFLARLLGRTAPNPRKPLVTCASVSLHAQVVRWVQPAQ
jgi:hypothetical protein